MSEHAGLDAQLGTEFLGYRIEAVVGRGGMGIVYRAYDLRLKRNVALKLVAPEYAEDDRFRSRFLTETELAASLEHPDVVPVYDAGEVDGQLYLAMRFVEGTDLKHLLLTDAPLEPVRALTIAAHVAEALDAAHAQGLVHRDVKPSNVLLDERGHPYLADFGLTRRLDDPGSPTAGLSVGTPAYVAPEQIRGGDLDGRADQYALACMVHECLTGQPPFRRATEVALLYAHLEDEPVPTGAPIDAVFARALAKDPEVRYPSCSALVEDARRALGIAGPKPKRRWPFAVAVVLLTAAAAALGALLVTRDGSAPAVETAGHLVRIDPDGRVAQTIAVGTEPNEIELTPGKVWVADRAEKKLYRIDAGSGELDVEASAQGTPTDLAVRGEYVVLTHGPTEAGAVLFNVGTGGVNDSFNLSEGPFAFGSPRVAARDDAIWVATGGRRVGRLSRVRGSLVASVKLPRDADEADAFVSAMAIDDTGLWVVGDPNQPELWRVDPGSGRIVATVHLPSAPTDVAVGLGAVWVTSYLDDVVMRVDPAAGRVTDTVPVGRGAAAIAVGASHAWVANELDGSVSRIDPATLGVETVHLEGSPLDVAVADGGTWVATRPHPPAADAEAIAVGVVASCEGPFGSFGELSFAGAELPLILRGARLAARKPADGVTGARIADRPVDLRLECGDDSGTTALAKARRLVDGVGVDILIGSTQASESFAIRELARRRPEVTFLNGTAYPQALTLQDAPANFFRFTPDGPQWTAGLGSYAYHDLGWRRVVTVGDDWLGGYIATAGFTAEFCSLGGTIAKYVWVPLGATDLARHVAQVPKTGVDGFLMAGLPSTTQAFLDGLPRLRRRLAEQIVGGVFLWSNADAGAPVGRVVAAEGLGPVPENSRFLADFGRVFPDLAPFAWDIWSVYFYTPMEASLRSLEAVGGDLDDGQAAFRDALSKIVLEAPNGTVRLDERRQAIASSYLVNYRKSGSGPPVLHPVREIQNVEQTFNGYFGPDDPPLGRDTIECKRGDPPPWARR